MSIQSLFSNTTQNSKKNVQISNVLAITIHSITPLILTFSFSLQLCQVSGKREKPSWVCCFSLSSFAFLFYHYHLASNNKQSSSPQKKFICFPPFFPSIFMTLKMKRDVEMDEVEAVLEKIWDLHDKLSDEIHSISRTHFVNSTKSIKNSNTHENNFKNNSFKHHSQTQTQTQFFDHEFKDYNNVNTNGFVFFKDFDKNCAIAEAKSLNSIRSALENLEEQLEFFNTVQIQQRAERDAALARLEQSRIILALRLAEHHGKRYKVIDEAMDFVGNVRDATCFVGPDNFSNPPASAPAEHSIQKKGITSSIFVRLLFSGLDSAKRTLQLDKLGGVLGNAALFAISMVALLHLQQATSKDNDMLDSVLNQDRRTVKKLLQRNGSSSTGQLNPLDVRLARG